MAWTGTVIYAVFGTFTDPVPTWAGMRMDTGTITGYREIVRVNKPQFHGRDNGSNGEELLKGFFIIKGEIPVSQGINRYLVSDVGMSVGKLFIFSRFGRWLFVLTDSEQVITSGFFEGMIS